MTIRPAAWRFGALALASLLAACNGSSDDDNATNFDACITAVDKSLVITPTESTTWFQTKAS